MKVVALRVKDFKRLKDIAITPDPTLVVITGRNGAGKTSVMDALESAIGGAGASPAEPVRKGAGRAEVVVDLGDLVVKRRWDRDGKNRLYLENPDGTRPAKPQALLDSLFERVAFDPVRFLTWEPRKQAQVLRSLAGLDEVFAGIDSRHRALYDERAEVNRAVKADEGALAQYGAEVERYPNEPVDISEVAARYQAAVDEQAQNRQIRDAVEHDRARLRRAVEDQAKAEEEIDRLQELLDQARARFRDCRTSRDLAREALEESLAASRGLVDPDADAVLAELNGATKTNRLAAQKAAWRETRDRWEQNREHALTLTSAMTALEREKEKALNEAAYPVPGLAVRGDDVTLDGLPLSNLNSATRIRLGLAVGAALNPGLKVAIVRDGSLLDHDGMRVLQEWAEFEGFQIWVERVGNLDSEGVVIEDGEVLADRQPNRPPDRKTLFQQMESESPEVF